MFLLILFIINKFIDFVAWMLSYMHVFIYLFNKYYIHTIGQCNYQAVKLKNFINRNEIMQIYMLEL